MMQQYRELISTVNIDVQPEEQQAADHYYKTAMTLKLIAIFFLVFALVSVIFSLKAKWIVYIIAILMVFLYAWYKEKSSASFRNILLNECNPQKMLSFYVALTAHSNHNKNWDTHFYNICKGLYYAGRFDDVKKVLALFSKYCSDNMSRLKYEIIRANLAFYEKDEDALLTCCDNIEKLAGMVKPKGNFNYLAVEAMTYPVLLKMENEKEYQKVYDMFQQETFSYYKSMLSPVKKNYYMFKMAKAMGDEETARQHGEFILKNGGSLWYRREIELHMV